MTNEAADRHGHFERLDADHSQEAMRAFLDRRRAEVADELARMAASCPDCQGTERLPDGEMCPCRARRLETERRARARKTTAEYVARLNITSPAEFERYSLETFPGDQQAYTAIQRWVQEPRNMVLWGSSQGGKSSLAYCALRAAQEQRMVAGLFVFVPTMLDRLRQAQFDRAFPLATVIETLCEVPLLVLDDIGAHKASEFVCERIGEIITVRKMQLRPTLVTTNLTIMGKGDTVETHLGTRIAERLNAYELVHVDASAMKRRGVRS